MAPLGGIISKDIHLTRPNTRLGGPRRMTAVRPFPFGLLLLHSFLIFPPSLVLCGFSRWRANAGGSDVRHYRWRKMGGLYLDWWEKPPP